MQQTPNLHTIINYACEEAGRLGNTEILPDHMMLGILRLGAGKAFELLMQAGMNPIELKKKIDERLLQDTPTQTNKLSPSYKNCSCNSIVTQPDVANVKLPSYTHKSDVNVSHPAIRSDLSVFLRYTAILRVLPPPDC